MSKSRKNSARMDARHFTTLTQRYLRQLFLNPVSCIMLILQVPIMLVIIRIIHTDNNAFAVGGYPANTTIMILVIISSLMGILNSYREISKERDILAREVIGGLDIVAYVTSKFAVQAIIAIAQSLMLVFGTYIFIDFHMTNIYLGTLIYVFTIFSVILSSATVGILVSALLGKSDGVLPVLLIIICQIVFSGSIVPLTKFMEVISVAIPTRWGVGILGRLFNLNVAMNLVYKTRMIYDFIGLGLITFVSYAATITVLAGKKEARKKLFNR